MVVKKGGERADQEAVIAWARLHEKKWPCLKWLHSNRNEATSIGQRVKGAKMGIKKGILDMFLPYPAIYETQDPFSRVLTYHGLYIEMKYGKGKLTEDQIEFREYALDQGYKVVVCWSADDAIKQIKEYLNG